MTIDYSKLSIDELNEIISQAAAARLRLIEIRRAELLEELEKLDASAVISPAQSITRNRKSKRKRKLYTDKNGNTWGGAGRRPPWVMELVESGANLSDYEVKE